MNPHLKSWQRPDRRIQLIVLVLACLMFLPALGSYGVVNTSDAYYTEAAREMLKRGDFITPYLNYAPYYYKPILTYWLIIASYVSFGVNTFAARLPSALSAIATVLVLYSLCEPLIGRRASFFAALALVSMPLFVIVGHIALTDMPLILFTTVTNLLLIRNLVQESSDRKCLIPAYLCLGLALLSKGPLAVLVVGTCIGGFLLVTSESVSDFRRRVLLLKPMLAVAIPLAVALPWFVAEHIASNGAFTNFFFIEQNFGRLSGQSKSHLAPAWFYIPYLFGGFLPWLPLLLTAPFVLRLRGANRLSKSPRVQLTIAACCWFFGTLAILMISASKLAHYLLPLAPPIAILTGVFLDKVIRLGRRRFILWGAPALALSCFIGLCGLPKVLAGAADLRIVAIVSLVISILGCAACAVLLYRSKIRTGVSLLCLGTVLGCAVLVPVGMEQTYRQGNEGFEYLVKSTDELHDANIAVLANVSATAAFYAEKRVFEIVDAYDCQRFLKATKGPHYFILDEKAIPNWTPFIPGSCRVVASKGKWTLVLVEDVHQDKQDKLMAGRTSKQL